VGLLDTRCVRSVFVGVIFRGCGWISVCVCASKSNMRNHSNSVIQTPGQMLKDAVIK
jgi:hypothetical protein